jgi:uncharacterized protein (TIGR02996 family)
VNLLEKPMSVEDAFLAQLAANPADDLTRLVYADWLDERDDPRGRFLRLEQERAGLDENDPRAADLDRDLGERIRALSWDWLSAAGKRWDVWLMGFPVARKISVIKALRELTDCGLRLGLQTVNAVPACVLISCSRGGSQVARRHLEAVGTESDGPVTVSVRPCPDPSSTPAFKAPEWFALDLSGPLPGQESAMLAAIDTHFEWAAQAARLASPTAPAAIGHYPTEQAARLGNELLAGLAETQVRRVATERTPVRVPILWRSDSTGPYRVLLMSYPVERKVQIIKAIREATGVGLSEAMQRSQRRPPIVLRERVDGSEVERVRRLFADIGTIEIRADP